MSFISTVLREVGVEHVVFGGGRQIEHLIDDLRSGSARVIVATDVASRYVMLGFGTCVKFEKSLQI